MNFAYLTTFYSYKGGVGRTLALANVGAALAKRGSGRVLLIDCDLEAPGLHRIEALRPSNQAAEGGVLPWLAQLDPHSAEPADDSRFWDAIYQPRSDLALYVLPACHGDDVADWYARIDWRAWFTSDPDTMISPLLQAFRRVLVEVQQRGYAYVLVDSRTGHSDLGGLMLFQLPHMAVIVSNYNDQNLGGLRPILQAMLPYTDRDRPPANGIMRGFFPPPAGHGADAHQLGVLERWLVFSPVPADRDLDELLDQRRARAKALLAADVALGGYSEIPAVLQFQLQETLAVLDAPESKLAERYLEIAQQIEANRAQRLRELGADLTAVTSPRRVDLSGRGETRVSAQGAIEKSTTAQGRTFEQRVAELLRLLGYEVSGETMGDGNRIDLIAKSRSGLRAEHFVIECKDQKAAISKDQVEKLWIWRDRERRSVPGADGMFITSGDYAPAARASAEVHGLLLSTLKELERKLFDPEPYVQTWLQSYEGKREAQAYVAQQLYAGDGAPEKSSAGASADADAAEGPDETEADESERADTRIDLIPYALDWLGGRTSAQRLPNRFWVLIGNYGTGKSTFTRRLTFELLRRRRAGEAWPLPILINLKERAGAPSLDNLLQEFLSEYRLNASVRQLRYGLEQGTAALLLDSFDEMALAQYGRTLEQQLREFARLVLEFPDAKVLLTSRTHLFRSEQELERSVLGRDGLAEAGSPLAATARELGASIQTLAPFTPAQIATFIRNQASPERAEAILEFIEQTHKLSDLAPTAVLLEMIISGYDALRTRARAGGVIAAELYQVFVDEWLGKRAHANAQLSQAQMTQWLQVLARQLWDAPGQRLHYRHLSDLIMARRELSAAIDPTRVDLELRTASFLTRNSAGDYGFSHRSFLEFFLARALVQCLMDTREAGLEAAAEQLVAALPDARLSPECLRFFQDLAQLACADVTPFWLHASRVVRQLLSKVRAPARSANALRMARECAADPQEWIPEGAELAGADLSDEAWPLPLRKANLRGARLQRCRFSAGGNGPRVADLTAAILVEAEVDHANFGGARLRSADATGIRGEWTTWIGAHCQQARFAGAYLREADFRAAALDGADFSAAMLGNALFRGARPKGCAWTGADCQQARFAGAYLCGADFRAAALDGADFSAAMLGNARFRGARLKGCAWTGADLCAVQYSERPQQKAPRATAPRAELRWAASSNPTALLAATPPFLLVARNAVIEVWDCAVGTRTAVLEGHQHWITAVAALPDGRLASGAGDHSIRLWDAQGNCTAVLEGHQGWVLALAALPDGRLASGAGDGSIRVWDALGNCTAVLKGHQDWVRALAVLPNGRLASGADDGSIRLWDVRGKPVRTHVALAGAKVLALTVLGDVLVAGLGTGEILYFDIRPAALAHSSSLRRVLAARFQGEEQMLLYPDGAFWWPDRHDGLLPELADETWYRLVGSELFDPDAAFPASAIPEQRLPRPRTIEEILGPLPGSDAGKRRRVRKA
ncbi:MAG: pentapeptide repeat-containing protein [Lysobacterales bacterium]